jgi:hypothetical protein
LVTQIEIHGYAIVSRDDRIADAKGLMPASLKNDADWAYFQAELGRADYVVIGRASHEATPNIKRRKRIVLSRSARRLEKRADAWWWNPLELDFGELAKALAPATRIAVPGGQAAFDMFLKIGYSAFHLSRAERIALPAGRGLFSSCETGVAAETVLKEAGLHAGPTLDIDPQAGVTLTLWRPAA